MLTLVVRYKDNSRQARHSQPDVGCQFSTSPHPFPRIDHSKNGTESLRSRRAPTPSLIANPRLKSKLTRSDSSNLQIPNRERMEFFRLNSRPDPIDPLTTRHPPLVNAFLIVTLESK